MINLLTEEELRLAKKVKCKKGDIIFHENDVCLYVGIISIGSLTISSITFEGREIIYNTLNANDMFGNNLLFSKDSVYRGDVKAILDTTIYLFDKTSLIKIFQSNEAFLNKYLQIQSDFSKSLNFKIKLLSFNNAKERFLYYLFINKNEIRIKSITSLANSLFLTREVTSRLVNNMIKSGEIIKRNNIITKVR